MAGVGKKREGLEVGAAILLEVDEDQYGLARILQRAWKQDSSMLGGEGFLYMVAVASWIGRKKECLPTLPQFREVALVGSKKKTPWIEWIEGTELPDCAQALPDLIPPSQQEKRLRLSEEDEEFPASWEDLARDLRRKPYRRKLEAEEAAKERVSRAEDGALRKKSSKTKGGPNRAGPASGNFEIQKKRVLWKGTELEGVDPKTFRELSPNWGADAARAYANGKAAAGIDPRELLVLNALFLASSAGVYVGSAPIPRVDSASFRPLDAGVRYEGTTFPVPIFEGYARDAKRAYFAAAAPESVVLLEGADLGSLISRGGEHALDRSNVYYRGVKIKGANPKQWRSMGFGYGADERQVYWGARAMPEADRFGFKVISNVPEALATDSKLFFLGGETVSRPEWIETLRMDAKRTAKILREEFGIKVELKTPS